MNSLPDLAWAAVISGDTIQAMSMKRWVNRRTARNDVLDIARRGDRSLPVNVMEFPIRNEGKRPRMLLVQKVSQMPFGAYEKEIGQGIIKVMETVSEFHRLKHQEFLLHEAEIKMLQSQINPHFLFNVLNTISFYCRKSPMQARKLVTYLADYYRQNLTTPGTMIPVEQEIRHVQAYVNIEKARFQDRLSIQYRLSCSMFNVPALIMQPLVENAILHGVLPCKDGGHIRVSVFERDHEYVVYVYDNGCGMDEEKAASLLIPGIRRTSIGLINVHQRLLFIYGEGSGLRIISKKNKGTLVSFCIPKKRKLTSDTDPTHLTMH